MGRDTNCIFCDILAGKADASIVFQDAEVTVFMDLFPVNPGHLLVIPNAHSAEIEGLDDEILGRMFTVGRMMALALRESGLRCEGVNLYLADGAAAGQIIFHSHLHVIPRFAGERSRIKLHGAPVSRAERAELDAQASRLQEVLEEMAQRPKPNDEEIA